MFSFPVMSGSLRADEFVSSDERGREHWKLSFPNKEVATVYKRLFFDWLATGRTTIRRLAPRKWSTRPSWRGC